MSDQILKAECITYCKERFPDDSEFVAKGVRMFNAIMAARELINDPVLAKRLGTCPCCSGKIGQVITSFSDITSVQVLYKLVKWCSDNGKNEFKTTDIKHLLDHSQYANLNHLDRFGGIVYRPKNPKTGKPYRSTYYAINLTRAHEFFRNERPAPVQIISNRVTGERIASTDKLLKDFPNIGEFLEADGRYDPDHIVPDRQAVPRQDSLPTVPQHYPQK